MSFNGSGVYTLPGAQLANGEVVSASENNQFRNDVASALNVAWTRDGQAPATDDIPMGSHKFTGLAAGTTAGDSVRYEQVTSSVSITGGSISGVTLGSLGSPIPVNSGGTGATTAGAALSNLGAQAQLVSTVNIKTVNGNDLIGSGNVTIPTVTDGDKGDITVSSSGSVWSIDGGVVDPDKLNPGHPSWDSAGVFSMNSGYGSNAPVYGCRAWVNFNGTGTLAVRSSGNVSSVSDDGTGTYTITFASALPDANYSIGGFGQAYATGETCIVCSETGDTYSSTAVKIRTMDNEAAYNDNPIVCIQVVR